MPFDLASQPLSILLAAMATAGVIVWYAGSRLAWLVDVLAERTGIGHAFAGMLLLGGITSLPEVATVTTSSATGNPALALNNLLGAASLNVLLLAIGDAVFGRGSLTWQAAKPATPLQGVLGMALLSAVVVGIASGDWSVPLLGVGAMALLIALGCIQAIRIASRFETAHVWEAVDPPEHERIERVADQRSTRSIVALIALAAAVIFVAGAALSFTGDAIAEVTGLGTSFIGFTLLAMGTTLPEISSVFAALKLRRYEMAIGDIFGTNLFNIQLILLADLIYRGEPVLREAGRFEMAAAALGVVLTGIFVVGLIERRNRPVWRMGRDSMLVVVVFAGGLYALSGLI